MDIKLLKRELKSKTDKNPEKYYPISVLQNLGFNRSTCKKCSTKYWSIDERSTCGEPDCNDGYSFINNSPTKKKIGYIDTWKEYSKHFKKLGYTPIKRYPVVARWRDDTWFTQASIYCFQPYVVTGQVKPPANPLVMSQPSLRFNDIDNVGITGRHYSTHFHLGQHAFVPKEEYDQEKYLSDIISWIKDGAKIPLEEIQFHEDQWGGGGNLGTSLEYFSNGLELGNQVYMKYKITPGGYKDLPLNILDMGSGQERYPWLTSGNPISYELTMPDSIKYLYKQSGIKPDKKLWEKFVPLSGKLNIDEVDDIEKTWSNVSKKIGYTKEELKKEIYPVSSLYAIADHFRTLLFSSSDGALPSNSGGGYNLRSIFRRSMDLSNKYNINFDYKKLIELQANYLKPQYPELKKSINTVNKILESEEKKYKNNIENSNKLLKKIVIEKLTSEKMIELYDSKGISPEQLEKVAISQNKKLKIPADFYTKISERHEKNIVQKFEETEETELNLEPTIKLFWADEKLREFEARVIKIFDNKVILDKTLFYATSGGQLNDTGYINGCKVIDVYNKGPHIIHELENINFKEGELVIGNINDIRRTNTMRHHTATHVVGGAARIVLGDHLWQGGSDVNQDRGRLDITHYDNLSKKEIKKIEEVANKAISQKIQVTKEIYPKDQAEKIFGFTLYQGGFVPGSEIRVLHVKGFDAQACGGTHLDNTSELKKIKIINSKKVQDGLIRLTYVAGDVAEKLEIEEKELGKEVMKAFGFKTNTDIDSIESAAEILKTQKNHLAKNITKFMNETKDIMNKLDYSDSEIQSKLKFDKNNIVKSVEELFILWKKTKKQYKKLRK
ncbi:MAG: alanine--tRNA ligase [Candidatus Woesearchaeota archaeon]